MKKFLEILICCVIALGIGAGCKTEPGPGGDPTPVPDTTEVPVPTEVPPQPTPVDTRPCVSTGAMDAYQGNCQESDKCRNGHDKFFYGICETKEAM